MSDNGVGGGDSFIMCVLGPPWQADRNEAFFPVIITPLIKSADFLFSDVNRFIHIPISKHLTSKNIFLIHQREKSSRKMKRKKRIHLEKEMKGQCIEDIWKDV